MKKKWAVGTLCGFLAVMAVCTVVAKGIYAAGLARVSVVLPEEKNITHDIQLQGFAEAGQEYGIYVPAGLRVETVTARVGDAVEAGDELFTLRMADLEQAYLNAEAEVSYLEACLQDIRENGQQEERKREKELVRLNEDYNSLVREKDLEISRKRQVYQEAKEQREAVEKGLTGTVSGGDAAADIESLRRAEQQASWELEDAILQKETALLQWNREAEDAGTKEYTASAETVRQRGELESKRKELETLKELCEKQGQICAGEAGILTECRVAAGEAVPDTAAILYTVDGGAVTASFEVNKDALKYISIGDRVTLEYKAGNGGKRMQESTVSYMETEDDGSRVRVQFAETGIIPGQVVTLKYRFVSERFATVIPREALHKEQNGTCYVYVAEERQGFLGPEEKVRRVDVTLLDESESYAAVESPALTLDSRVITVSSKTLAEDDAVRVTE